MVNLNLNPYTQLTLEEARERLDEYRIERKELRFKYKHGMPMTNEERDRHEVIDALVEQMEFIVEWMVLTDEEEYDWPTD